MECTINDFTLDVSIEYYKYRNGRTAIELIDTSDGFPFLMATVNIPEAPLAPNQVIIKNWSENKGVLKFLQDNGIVGKVLYQVPIGYVMADVVELLITE